MALLQKPPLSAFFRYLRLSVAALALTALAAATAQAEEAAQNQDDADAASARHRILVLPYSSIHRMLPAQTGEKSAQFLKTELRGSEGVKLVRLKRSADAASVVNPTPARDQSQLNRASQSAAEASAALDNGDFTLAITKFHEAIDLEKAQHPYVAFTDLRQQFIGLAVASFQLGEEDEGIRYLEAAARIDPTQRLDAKKLPPIFVRTFDDVLRQLGEQPRASLTVDCSVPSSKVLLDGRELGVTPLSRTDLLSGTHYLQIIPPQGTTVWAQPVDLISGQQAKVSAKIDLIGGALAEIDRELSDNQLTQAVIERATELARHSAASHVVLGGIHQDKDGIAVTSYLLSIGDKTVCPIERALFDAGMMSAGIELYKVGADIVQKLEKCPSPRRLPSPVAAEVPTRTAQASLVRPDALTNFMAYEHTPAAKHQKSAAPPPQQPPAATVTDDAAPRNADLQPPAPVVAASIGDEPGSDTPWTQAEQADPAVKEEKRSLTWLWITLGVVAAAGIATGSYFIYDATHEPKGSGTVSWAL